MHARGNDCPTVTLHLQGGGIPAASGSKGEVCLELEELEGSAHSSSDSLHAVLVYPASAHFLLAEHTGSAGSVLLPFH